MNTNKNIKMAKRNFGTTMGVTSIIAILVILVLVVFSTLSLITAKADHKLSQKTSDNIKAYYTADAKGEEIISQIAEIIASKGNAEKYAAEKNYKYQNTAKGTLVKFTIAIDSSRVLNGEVLFSSKGKAEKRLWQVTPAEDWEADNPIELFQ